MNESTAIIPAERIERGILIIRGQKVMLDADLAELYGVPTKALNQAVKRNADRFPADFMFQLTEEEKRQVVTVCDHLQRLRYSPTLPFAFTEHGAIMLSSVLNSPVAVQVTLQVVRTFVRMRQLLATHTDLARKMATLEKKYDGQFRVVFDTIKKLMQPDAGPGGKKLGSDTGHKSRNRHAGVILAAGASSRMGSPKALLQMPDGKPLAWHQSQLLKKGGCDKVVIVLGSNAASIRNDLADCETVTNAEWAAGRLGSVQAGLRALPGYDGYFILPVDTVGVRPATVQAMISRVHVGALRPCHAGEPGRLVWLSAETARMVLACADPAARLDGLLTPFETRLDVDDPGLLSNLNTPDEWQRWLINVGKSGGRC